MKSVDIVLENLAKIYIVAGEKIGEIEKLYDIVHKDDNKSLVETLYADAKYNLNNGIKEDSKAVLKDATKALLFIAKKDEDYSTQVNNALKSLAKEYGN